MKHVCIQFGLIEPVDEDYDCRELCAACNFGNEPCVCGEYEDSLIYDSDEGIIFGNDEDE